MSHGLNLAGFVNAWITHQRQPPGSRGFVRVGSAVLPGAGAALPAGPVFPPDAATPTTVIAFTTDELAVRLARFVWFDNWAGSAGCGVYIRSRGAILEEYQSLWTHDLEGSAAIPRLDVLCPPFSQIELIGHNLTDSGNDRPVVWYVSGWLEPWPKSRVPPDQWSGE